MSNKSRVGWIAVLLATLVAAPGWTVASLEESFSMEPLRDPFWPVGFFPDNWQQMNELDEEAPSQTSGSDWDAPAAQIRVTGTSRLDNKTVAIINGDLKEVGDFIEVSYNGRIYQWKLKEINASGKVLLDRVKIRSGSIGFHPGDKK